MSYKVKSFLDYEPRISPDYWLKSLEENSSDLLGIKFILLMHGFILREFLSGKAISAGCYQEKQDKVAAWGHFSVLFDRFVATASQGIWEKSEKHLFDQQAAK